jgi:hypothetical protein
MGIIGIGRTKVVDVPEGLRTVSEYNRPSNTLTLPAETSGGLYSLSLGVGVVVLGRFDVAYDWAWRWSYHGGRTAWSQISFPSDDHLGYAYSGTDSTVTAAVSLRKGPNTPYLATGVRFYCDRLASGHDDFARFGEQHGRPFRGRSPVIGLGWRSGFLEVEVEWSRARSNDATPTRASHLRFCLRATPLRSR